MILIPFHMGTTASFHIVSVIYSDMEALQRVLYQLNTWNTNKIELKTGLRGFHNLCSVNVTEFQKGPCLDDIGASTQE